MKILVDENIPLMTVKALRERGHDILDIRGGPDEGMTDDDLWQLCRSELRLMITTDKGFAQRRNEEHQGILVVRLRQPNRQRIHDRIMAVLDQVPETDWPRLLVTARDRLHSLWSPPKS